jgi:hypothetical protein
VATRPLAKGLCGGSIFPWAKRSQLRPSRDEPEARPASTPGGLLSRLLGHSKRDSSHGSSWTVNRAADHRSAAQARKSTLSSGSPVRSSTPVTIPQSRYTPPAQPSRQAREGLVFDPCQDGFQELRQAIGAEDGDTPVAEHDRLPLRLALPRPPTPLATLGAGHPVGTEQPRAIERRPGSLCRCARMRLRRHTWLPRCRAYGVS